jgi:hypothetical protein
MVTRAELTLQFQQGAVARAEKSGSMSNVGVRE